MLPVEAMLERAQLLLAQGRPKDAEKLLKDALREDPENDVALSLLARCKYDQRLYNEGIGIIQRAIQASPNEAYYFYLLAFGYYQTNVNASAKRYLNRAIELNPYGADFFGLLALIHIEEKEFKQALEKANEGLAVDAENITSLNARSTALNKLKRVDDAIETMQNALMQDPENDFTHSTIGWNLLEKGRHKEAADHFREALRINPNHDGARIGLKESLKSKIPPYKWLLQYSFWINNKGKNARWAIPLGIFFVVRLVAQASDSAAAGSGLAFLAAGVIALYILFVATSWLINPLANFCLLFNKDGKYAVTASERWGAIFMMVALVSGLAVMLTSVIIAGPVLTNWLLAGFVLFSLALPLGHMAYPIQLRHNKRVQWFSLALVTLGILAFLTAFLHIPLSDTLLTAYGIAFVIYTWVGAFSSGNR